MRLNYRYFFGFNVRPVITVAQSYANCKVDINDVFVFADANQFERLIVEVSSLQQLISLDHEPRNLNPNAWKEMFFTQKRLGSD